jgi:uncharacterized membrane protein (DUF2068 family)
MILSGKASQIFGLRTIAIFEAFKGLVVLIAGLALLHYMHRDLAQFAADLVRKLHLNPAGRLPRFFEDAVERVPDAQVSTLALGAFLYSIVRFIEAYGLWRNRGWAEWFALVSCGVYLPVEAFEFLKTPSASTAALFAVNAAVVLFLWFLLASRSTKSGNSDPQQFGGKGGSAAVSQNLLANPTSSQSSSRVEGFRK